MLTLTMSPAARCLRLLALLVLVAGALAAPAAVGQASLVLADEDRDESGQERDEDDDGNEGNGGNDDDGDDNDDGRGNGNQGNGNEGNGNEGNGNQGNGDEPEGLVEPAADYQVEVECAYDEDAHATTCTFTGVAPPDAKDVSHVDLPAEEVCAEVVGGEHEFVDPDPNTRVVGYKSRGSEGTFTLVMTGEVTTGGTATYWFKTGDGVFPATGPGLVCGETEEAAPVQITVTLEEVDEPQTVTAGAIVVQVFACAETPDAAAFDWYGGCEPGGEGVPFMLAPSDGMQATAAAEGATDAEGTFRVEELAPGTYDLEAPDTVWCHAESDGVNERGEVVVEAGEETSVWIFFFGAEVTK